MDVFLDALRSVRVFQRKMLLLQSIVVDIGMPPVEL